MSKPKVVEKSYTPVPVEPQCVVVTIEVVIPMRDHHSGIDAVCDALERLQQCCAAETVNVRYIANDFDAATTILNSRRYHE